MDRIIDYKKILVTNLPLLITLPPDSVGRYNARVDDIGEKFFDISCPTVGGVPVSVNKNSELRMTISGSGGYYFFASKVVERAGKYYPLLRMALPAYIEKCERREFFRLEIMKKIKVYGAGLTVKGDDIDIFSDNLIGECLCVEIGGGGARLVSAYQFAEGTILGLDISPVIKNFNIVKCLVVRSEVRLDNMTDIGIKFIQLRTAERDAIVKSCYSKQIERRYMLTGIKL